MIRKMHGSKESKMKCALIRRDAIFSFGSYLDQLGELKKSNKRKTILLYKKRSNKFGRNNWQHWYYKGLVNTLSDSEPKALKCYDKAIQLNHNLSQTHSMWHKKAMSMQHSGHYSEALKFFDESIRLKPTSQAFVDKGRLFCETDHADKVLSCYDEATKINPKDIRAWSHKGMFLCDKDNYRKALKCFNEIIRIRQNDRTAWFYKGMILQRLGQYLKSQECFEQTIHLCKKPLIT